jgi:hypothetical protein
LKSIPSSRQRAALAELLEIVTTRPSSAALPKPPPWNLHAEAHVVSATREELCMTTILIIVLLIVLLGGGGGYYGYRSYGGAGLGGALGLVLVVLLVVWLAGGLPLRA